MKRLIVFGPSSSYGIGLDNKDTEVFGAILSQKLNRKFVNNSIPGASNKLICHSIVSFDYQEGDLVIILWAFNDRYTILKSETEFINIMPSYTNEKSVNYYKNIHEDYDHTFMSKVYVNYGINYLVNKNIKNFSLFHGKTQKETLDNETHLIPLYYTDFDKGYPRASDGVHLGIEGNKNLGNTLYKYITKLSEINTDTEFI